jgi:hypothetical protein
MLDESPGAIMADRIVARLMDRDCTKAEEDLLLGVIADLMFEGMKARVKAEMGGQGSNPQPPASGKGVPHGKA